MILGGLFAAVGWVKVTRVMVGLRKPDNHVSMHSRRINVIP